MDSDDGGYTAYSVNPDYSLVHEPMAGDAEYTTDGGDVEVVIKSDGHAGAFSTVINSVKVCIGAGVLSAPFAIARGSTLPGALVVVGVAAMSSLTFACVGYCCDRVDAGSYGELFRKVYTPKNEWMINLPLAFLTFFGALTYAIVVGDFFSELFQYVSPDFDGFVSTRHFWILSIGLVVLLPLTFLRNLHSLRFSSYLGVIGITYTVILMVVLFFTNNNNNNDGEGLIHCDVEHFKVDPVLGIFQTVAIFAFAFGAHIHAPMLYKELKGRSPRKWVGISAAAYTLILSLYLLYGLLGFWTYGPDVESNSISSMPTDDVWVVLCRLMMGFSVIASFPLLFYALRFSVHETICNVRLIYGHPEYPRGTQERMRVIEILVLWAVQMGLANVFKDVGIVMSFAGAGPGTILTFVFPVLIYLKLFPLGKDTTPGQYYTLMTLMFVGVSAGVVALVVTIMDMAGAI